MAYRLDHIIYTMVCTRHTDFIILSIPWSVHGIQTLSYYIYHGLYTAYRLYHTIYTMVCTWHTDGHYSNINSSFFFIFLELKFNLTIRNRIQLIIMDQDSNRKFNRCYICRSNCPVFLYITFMFILQ